MLRDRVITAVIAIAIIVPIFVFGGVEGVVLLVGVFGGIALWELARSLPSLKSPPGKELTFVLGIAMVLAFYLCQPRALIGALVWFPLLVLVIHLFLYETIDRTVDSASQMIFAVLYVIVPLSHAILVRRLDLGVTWVLFIMLVICLGDAGAYFVGRAYGRRRFWEKVSPSKTVEGLGGGVAGNLLGMAVSKALFPELPALGILLALTLLLAIAGPLGDLIASAIKRRLAIKDYGSIMPGHGGVMDRADSLILAFPTTYYFLLLLTDSVTP